MSESNGSTVHLSQKHTFEFGSGQKLTALVNDLQFLYEEVLETSKPKEGQPELTHWNFLKAFLAALKAEHKADDGSELKITLGETDVFVDRIAIEYTKKKAALSEEWRSQRKSPTSTTSTPPA
jgi:hypothetical protein